MSDTGSLTLAIIIGTVLVLTMVFFVAMLLVVNTDRRHKHQAELAELNMRREREVMEAEREATRQTLREVGRELHDNVGQLLTVAQIGMNNALEMSADAGLSSARDVLEQGIEEVRRLGRTLNTDMWEDHGLQEAIQVEAGRLERVARVKAHVLLDGDPPELASDTKTILFRVFQEIISNALRHGSADLLEIRIGGNSGTLLTVSDNGSGFDPDMVRKGSGLLNIRRRCELIGLEAVCSSAPGRGTTWQIKQRITDGTSSGPGR